MRKSLVAILLLAGAVFAGAMLYWPKADVPKSAQAQGTGQRPANRVPVETAMAKAVTASTDIRAVGSLQSDESVQIAPEIAGRVAEIAFREGEPVKQGDILIKFDDALAKAEIAEQEARYALAKSNYDRAVQLSRTGNVTDRARDEATAAYESAKATLELARVRLSKLTIEAPFAGVVGLRNVSSGAYVNAGTVLVNLEKIDTLKVDFSVPENFLASISVGQNVEMAVDALPNRTFAGSIYAINPMVDVNGRALRIRARLANPEGVLRPGLFARVTVKGPSEQNVVTVPESAIVARGGESFIYRIENGRAIEAKVRLGERKAGFVEILEGVAKDTTVVTAGQQRLRDGAVVEIVTADAQAKG